MPAAVVATRKQAAREAIDTTGVNAKLTGHQPGNVNTSDRRPTVSVVSQPIAGMRPPEVLVSGFENRQRPSALQGAAKRRLLTEQQCTALRKI